MEDADINSLVEISVFAKNMSADAMRTAYEGGKIKWSISSMDL